jgi:hypothetical protein
MRRLGSAFRRIAFCPRFFCGKQLAAWRNPPAREFSASVARVDRSPSNSAGAAEGARRVVARRFSPRRPSSGARTLPHVPRERVARMKATALAGALAVEDLQSSSARRGSTISAASAASMARRVQARAGTGTSRASERARVGLRATPRDGGWFRESRRAAELGAGGAVRGLFAPRSVVRAIPGEHQSESPTCNAATGRVFGTEADCRDPSGRMTIKTWSASITAKSSKSPRRSMNGSAK